MDDHHARVWDIMERVGVCMLTTRFADGLRARPVEARPDRKNGVLYFVTDARSGKEHEIAEHHEVGLTFVSTKDKAYLSITGRAAVIDDRARLAQIWKKTDTVWWPGGPDDPNARVLRVELLTAELWDGPASKAAAAYEFAKARMTGDKPNLGENRKVTVDMRER
ncbi:MAG TPA: pyridoxamine 5'-phosphate oxidase family protein [Pseudolabrys sp.]|nr:pyridoxamine 5'-phosphate oxidase family protein [Pseudolabrys sp.]